MNSFNNNQKDHILQSSKHNNTTILTYIQLCKSGFCFNILMLMDSSDTRLGYKSNSTF